MNRMENEVMAKVERLEEDGSTLGGIRAQGKGLSLAQVQLRSLSPIADSVARSFYMKSFSAAEP
jgi:hypothetical protein